MVPAAGLTATWAGDGFGLVGVGCARVTPFDSLACDSVGTTIVACPFAGSVMVWGPWSQPSTAYAGNTVIAREYRPTVAFDRTDLLETPITFASP